jgi:hypothetical protein
MTNDAHSGSRWEPGHLRDQTAEPAVPPAQDVDPA